VIQWLNEPTIQAIRLNKRKEQMNNATKLVVMLTVLLIAGSASMAQQQGTVQIVPPSAKFRGKTYSEWAASFWQWMMALPLEGHPAIDDPAFVFGAGQSGSVWYWAAPDGPLTRTVTLAQGKALFLTIRDVETSTLEEPPFFGATEAEQRANSKFFADHIVNVFCVIDGVPVQNLQGFRFSTPQFRFTAPTPWIFGAVGGTGTAVGDGYFLMLTSIPKGTHTIHYGGTFHFEPGELGDEAFDFPKDITIQLTVTDDNN
jgi:hypothetical protein